MKRKAVIYSLAQQSRSGLMALVSPEPKTSSGTPVMNVPESVIPGRRALGGVRIAYPDRARSRSPVGTRAAGRR
jgi:hypothetical protein